MYFVRVPFKPAGVDDAQAANQAALQAQGELLHQLQLKEWTASVTVPTTVDSGLRVLSGFFAEAAQQHASSRFLLVLDDVWDPRILASLCSPSMRGAILVTARSSVCSDVAAAGRYVAAHTTRLQPGDDTRAAAKQLMEKLLESATYKDQVCAGFFGGF